MQKGMVRHGHRGYGRDIGLIVHIVHQHRSAHLNDKVLVCSVEEALKVGADSVSVHINVGSDTEANQLQKLGMSLRGAPTGECHCLRSCTQEAQR